MPSDIPFPQSSAPGAPGLPHEGGGRLINCYAEPQPEGSLGKVKYPRSAGLQRIADVVDHVHCRGGIIVGQQLLVAFQNELYSVKAGVGAQIIEDIGPLPGKKPITVAKNNHSPPDIMAVTEFGAFTLFTNLPPTSIEDSDLPFVNSVSHLDGFLLFTTPVGAIWSTKLNSLEVDSDAFQLAQIRDDGLLRGVAFRGEFFAFGQNSCEVYRNVGSIPFPLQFNLIIPRGIVGTHAVAGWEEGWSNELIWVADDNRVYQLVGYKETPISTQPVERAIMYTVDRSAIEASVYMVRGNAFWVITSPGEWSWEYNLTTKQWNEKQSYLRNDWRARRTFRAFQVWLAGDDLTGRLFWLNENYHREDGQSLVWQAESNLIVNFPARFTAAQADFAITSGTGKEDGSDPMQKDPVVLISWSNDGGYTFSSPLTRQLGHEADPNKRISVNRTGRVRAKGKRFRLEVSDPVDVGFYGGKIAGVA